MRWRRRTPAAPPRRPAGPRTRRASRRSRRRASRRSPEPGQPDEPLGAGHALGRRDAVAPIGGQPVGHVQAADPRAQPPHVVLEGRRVPQVVVVGHQAELGQAGVGQQLLGLGERGQERRGPALGQVRRLEGHRDARLAARLGHGLGALDRQPPRLGRVEVAVRAGEEEHALGLVRGEPGDAAAERLDPLADVGRALHPGHLQRQHRRHLGHAVRHRQAGLAQPRPAVRVVGGELELPQADRVEARGRVRRDVLGERCVEGRDLAEREPHRCSLPRSAPASDGALPTTRFGSPGRVRRLATR